MNTIRVLVVEDQNIVREGIVSVLSFQSNILVVGQTGDSYEAEQMVRQIKPDVVLLDLVLNGQPCNKTIATIRKTTPQTQILVLSGYAETEMIFNAIKAGAVGYMLKDTTREQLYQAISDVAEGLGSLHPSIALRVIREISNPSTNPPPNELLTARELDTLRLIGRGYSNQEISAELFVNDRTVAKYVSSILSKLNLENRTKAALYAVHEGLTEKKPST